MCYRDLHGLYVLCQWLEMLRRMECEVQGEDEAVRTCRAVEIEYFLKSMANVCVVLSRVVISSRNVSPPNASHCC